MLGKGHKMMSVISMIITAAIGVGVFLYFRHLGDDALRAEDEKEEQRHIGGL